MFVRRASPDSGDCTISNATRSCIQVSGLTFVQNAVVDSLVEMHWQDITKALEAVPEEDPRSAKMMAEKTIPWMVLSIKMTKPAITARAICWTTKVAESANQ